MKYLLCALALSFGVSYADIPANILNQTHDGAVINAGTYLNTAGHETTFTNTAGTGITLNAGSNIRGAEVLNGALTGNGGNIHIQAPDQVVRLNGNIDVRGFLPSGATGNIGNGGNVTIDSAFLFQNGNIYAGGMNGGNVQMNVGGMTMGPTSRIDATGQGGLGGKVVINSTGDVSINKGAFINTTGSESQVPLNSADETLYGNNIVIIGKGVNMNGSLLAGHASYADFMPGGSISIKSTDPGSDVNVGQGAIVQADGGAITISSQRAINQNGSLLSNSGSDMIFTGVDSIGTQGRNGGTISLNAVNSVNNTGRLQADGGVGDNSAALTGGQGGVITISAPAIANSGVIRAMGGNGGEDAGPGLGGAVSFIGSTPSDKGVVVTYGGIGDGMFPRPLGTITAPNPAASTNLLLGEWKKSP